MVVIAGHRRHRIGKKTTEEIFDIHSVLHKVTFIVVKRSNFAEWQRYFLELGGDPEWLKRLSHSVRRYRYFYEIYTD